ncbi:Uncharacterised protein [uncultured archaeon]|nr:Uncharacterised protein [uncultured archaeon]
MEFNPKILCPYCKTFLEFNKSTGRGLEYECPKGYTLSSGDIANINKKIMSQYDIHFQERYHQLIAVEKTIIT